MINYLKGRTISLLTPNSTAEDDFGNPIITETAVLVDNVLVASPSAEEVVGSINLYGKQLSYILGIPKGDQHDWEDKRVIIDSKTYYTFGPVEEGQEELVPGPWHKKVRVTRYE